MKQNVKKDYYRIKFIHFTSWLIGLFLIFLILAVLLSFSPGRWMEDDISIRLLNPDAGETYSDEALASAGISNSFVECDDFDIRHLIKNYYEALENGSRDDLSKYVDDLSGITDEELQMNIDYVEKYMDIQCYYMEGMMPGTYLVAAYSYVKYYGIYTTVPHIDEFYVCSNASGRYYISRKDIGDEVSSYNELMFANSQIMDMYEMAEKERANAIKYDSSVRELLEKTGQ